MLRRGNAEVVAIPQRSQSRSSAARGCGKVGGPSVEDFWIRGDFPPRGLFCFPFSRTPAVHEKGLAKALARHYALCSLDT